MSLNNELLYRILIRHEGKKNKVYRDTQGLLTAGVGHLCLPSDNLQFGEVVTDELIQNWLEADCINAAHIAKRYVPSLDQLDEVREVVIVSLAFNLGNRLGVFHNTLQAINMHNWNTAANDLEQSNWYQQVGRRGPELCNALRTGVFN